MVGHPIYYQRPTGRFDGSERRACDQRRLPSCPCEPNASLPPLAPPGVREQSNIGNDTDITCSRSLARINACVDWFGNGGERLLYEGE